MRTPLLVFISLLIITSCSSTKEEKWIPLFNGENLDGWTIKIKGYPVGENYQNTFRVEDGLLKVRYDGYDEFGERYGHLFTNKKYSNYKLRVEYRFIDEQVKGGPDWAYRNNGAMLHAQSAESMDINQDFPVSVEAQLLGGDGTNERTTGNVCTPGTHIHIDGELYTPHCLSSTSKTYHGDQWVTMEMIVYNDSLIHHVVEGDTVLTYTGIVVGGGNVNPEPNIPEGPLKEGHIAFQSESHPTDFRKIEIMEIK